MYLIQLSVETKFILTLIYLSITIDKLPSSVQLENVLNFVIVLLLFVFPLYVYQIPKLILIQEFRFGFDRKNNNFK